MANASKKSASTKSDAPAPVVAAAPAPSKAASKKSEKVVEKKEEVAAPAVKESKSKKSTAKSDAKSEEPAVAPAVVSESDAPEGNESSDKKQRRKVDKNTVCEDLDALITRVAAEIQSRTPAPVAVAPEASADSSAEAPAPAASASKKPKRKKDNGVPVKTIRTILKRLNSLKSDIAKVLKLKSKTARDNSKSGLMKPVGISEALYNFLKFAKFDVEKNGKYARVEITKKIHTYVASNNLRRETDKRVILPDTKLASLLNYDPKVATQEMTYFRLPQYLQPHFISDAPVAK